MHSELNHLYLNVYFPWAPSDTFECLNGVKERIMKTTTAAFKIRTTHMM